MKNTHAFLPLFEEKPKDVPRVKSRVNKGIPMSTKEVTPVNVTAKQRKIPRYLYWTWVWLGIISAIVLAISIYLLVSSSSSVTTTTEVAKNNENDTLKRSSVSSGKKKHDGVYPFNIYDDVQNRIVRYPATGGIHKLDWKTVMSFKVCCKDDDTKRCFDTNEIALRRDIERSLKGLPDVYLEIKQDHPTTTAGKTDWKPIGTIGSRCRLIWSKLN